MVRTSDRVGLKSFPTEKTGLQLKSMESSPSCWRKCSTCKADIGFDRSYFACNVSTCNGKRTGLVFCSLSCFERHLPGAKHRDAYAINEKSPPHEESQRQAPTPKESPNRSPTKRIIKSAPEATPISSQVLSRDSGGNKVREMEILVVASKVKDYIRRHSEMNTSAEVLQTLSDRIRALCDEAMDSAQADGRITVMGRDFKRK